MPGTFDDNSFVQYWRMINISLHVVNGLLRFLPTRRFLPNVARSITRLEVEYIDCQSNNYY